jgi:hypothetical protein
MKVVDSSISETESMENPRPNLLRVNRGNPVINFIKPRWSKHHPIFL